MSHVSWFFGYAFYEPVATLRADVVDVVMGLMYICQASVPTRNVQTPVPRTFGLPHLSISVSLNVLLTLMIIIRLVLHVRNIRAAMGTAGMGGLCKSIVTMLIESCTLYTVSSLLLIGPWVGGNPAASIFLGVLTQTQVRPFTRL